MFLGLVKNEFIKLFSKMKTYIIIFLFIALCVIITFILQSVEKNYFIMNDPQFMIESLEEQIEVEKIRISSIEENTSISEEDKKIEMEDANAHIEYLEDEIERYQSEADGDHDWRVSVRKDLEDMKEQLSYMKESPSSSPRDYEYLQQEIDRLEMLLSTDTSPDEEHMNTGINYLFNNILFISSAFLSFGLILFNAETVAGEYNPGTLKFLLIQPVTRIKVLLSKFVVMVLSSIGLIMGIQGLFFVGVGIFRGFGSYKRPMLTGIEYEVVIEKGIEVVQRIAGSGSYIPLWQYIVKMLILEAFVILVFTAFVFMISTIAKSSLVASTIGICLALGTNIIYSISETYRKVSYLNFFHFGEIDGIVSGGIIGNTQALHFTYPMAIIVSIITTIIFVLIALGVFKKRDLLI